MTEEALRAMFAPYGNIQEVHLLKKNPGSGGANSCQTRGACQPAVSLGSVHRRGRSIVGFQRAAAGAAMASRRQHSRSCGLICLAQSMLGLRCMWAHVCMHAMCNAGCAFVTYDRWSACEAAIAALHGKTQLEGAKMPIVVKFADAKVCCYAVTCSLQQHSQAAQLAEATGTQLGVQSGALAGMRTWECHVM